MNFRLATFVIENVQSKSAGRQVVESELAFLNLQVW